MRKQIFTFILFISFLSSSFCFAQSSDQRAYGLLKGKVKRISVNDGHGVAFNQNGKIFSIRIGSISPEGNNSVYGERINHDKKGRISFVQYKQEMGLLPTKVNYKYDKNGNLVAYELNGHEWCNYYTYSNFQNGLPLSVKLEEAAEAWSQEGNLKIKYTKFDSHGNWTECVWSGNVKETDDGGMTYNTHRYTNTIKREIFYY